MKWIAALGALLQIGAAHAFESYPEYRSLSRQEASNLDDPKSIDSEYSSDFVTYQRPTSWKLQSTSENGLFDFSIGSLGAKDFLIDQRLELEKSLTDKLKFRLIWFRDEDLEDRFSNQILELNYELSRLFSLAAYGSVYADKADDDVGFAIIHHTESKSTRFFAIFPDFQRNERNRDTDRWVKGHESRSYGIVTRTHRDALGRILEASFRWETPSDWRFPDDNRLRQSQRVAWQVFRHRQITAQHAHLVRISFDDKFEHDIFSSPVSEDLVRRKRFWAQIENEQMDSMGQSWKIGIHYFWRHYYGLARHVDYRDVLPYANLTSPWRGSSTQFQWHAGLDTNLRWSEFSGGWLDPATPDYDSQYRLNIGTHWKFKPQTELRFLFTFDLDQLASGFWEGGAGQMSIPF